MPIALGVNWIFWSCYKFNKISKSPEKVSMIVDMPRLSNVKELWKSLKMVTYYSHLLPCYLTITYLFQQLLWKNFRFWWTAACEAAFINLKTEISSERILVPYVPNLTVIFICDASAIGATSILSHVIDDQEWLIAFVLRSITSEQNY